MFSPTAFTYTQSGLEPPTYHASTLISAPRSNQLSHRRGGCVNSRYLFFLLDCVRYSVFMVKQGFWGETKFVFWSFTAPPKEKTVEAVHFDFL